MMFCGHQKSRKDPEECIELGFNGDRNDCQAYADVVSFHVTIEAVPSIPPAIDISGELSF